ncbi:MAG: hypothetical protein WAM28_02900, partial [Chlamydiales bacterium]
MFSHLNREALYNSFFDAINTFSEKVKSIKSSIFQKENKVNEIAQRAFSMTETEQSFDVSEATSSLQPDKGDAEDEITPSAPPYEMLDDIEEGSEATSSASLLSNRDQGIEGDQEATSSLQLDEGDAEDETTPSAPPPSYEDLENIKEGSEATSSASLLSNKDQGIEGDQEATSSLQLDEGDAED